MAMNTKFIIMTEAKIAAGSKLGLTFECWNMLNFDMLTHILDLG